MKGILRIFVPILFAGTSAWADVLNTSPFMKQCVFTIAGYSGESTLENLPVLVRLGTVAPTGFAYADCQADGSDIRFADKDGNLIPHEIDTWNTNGTSAVWVKVPAVSGTATTFTMYYKANPAVLPAITASDVWSGYTAVYHFKEDTTDLGTFERDATANALDAQIPESLVSKMAKNNQEGKIGSGFKETQEACYAQVPAGAGLAALSTYVTASGWMKLDSHAKGWGCVWTSKNDDLWHESNDGIALCFGGGLDKPYARGYSNQDAGATLTNSLLDAWHFVSCVYDNTNYALYVDGIAVTNIAGKTPVLGGSNYPLLMGGRTNNYGSYQSCGIYDEFRFKAAADSADWVKAEYDMVNGSSFVSGVAGNIERGNLVTVDILASSYTAEGALRVTGQLVTLGSTASSATVELEYGETEALGSSVAGSETLTEAGEFFVEIPNVTPGGTYYYRLKATGNDETTGVSGVQSFVVPVTTVLATAVSASFQNALATLSGSVTSKALGTTTVTLYLGTAADSLVAVDSKVVTGTGAFSFTVALETGVTYYYRFRAQDVNGGVTKNSNETEVGTVAVLDTSSYTWVGGTGEWTDETKWTKEANGYKYPTGDKTKVTFPADVESSVTLVSDVAVASLTILQNNSTGAVNGAGHKLVATTLTAAGTNAKAIFDNLGAGSNFGSKFANGAGSEVQFRNCTAGTVSADINTSKDNVVWRVGPNCKRLEMNQPNFNGTGSQFIIEDSYVYLWNNPGGMGTDSKVVFKGTTPILLNRVTMPPGYQVTYDFWLPEAPYAAAPLQTGNGGANFQMNAGKAAKIVVAGESPARLGKKKGTWRLFAWDFSLTKGVDTNSLDLTALKSSDTVTYSWKSGANTATSYPQYVDLTLNPNVGFLLIIH